MRNDHVYPNRSHGFRGKSMATACLQLVFGGFLACSLAEAGGSGGVSNQVDEALKYPNVNPKGDPHLPNVLLLGDSISIGYTIPVRRQLLGKANVHRPPENCCHTGYALSSEVGSPSCRLKGWLGTNKWDVIHFNWGIWDTHCLDNKTGMIVQDESKVTPDQVHNRYNLEQYRTNLTRIVTILEGTGARLVWASTTPLMYRKGDRFEDIPKYNAVAAEIMKARGISINDLYAFTLPETATWQQYDGHFLPLGNQHLGERVGKVILDILPAKDATGR